jgi:VWFA-related protein
MTTRFVLATITAIACTHATSTLPRAAAPDCPAGARGPVISVRAWVLDGKNRAVQRLQANDFVILENGAAQQPCEFRHVREPVSVGILADMSGSMRETSPDGPGVAAGAIDEFLKSSGPQDEYFFEEVGTGPAMRCLFTCDLTSIRARLQIKPLERTALVDGVYLALAAMRKARHQNRALLIVSDGYDNASVYTPNELKRALAETPVPMFLVIPASRWERVGLRGQAVLIADEQEMRARMLDVTESSGGLWLPVSDAREARGLASQLASAMRRPYLLTYVSSSAMSGTRARKIQVKLNRVKGLGAAKVGGTAAGPR